MQKKIDWSSLALAEIDPSWLQNIKWVEKLFLASNVLTSIPRNMHILYKLSVLDLTRNQLRSVPAHLLQLPRLRDLRLSENKIVELPDKCEWSPSLKALNLSDNLLGTLPRNMAKAKLAILHIARNKFYEVPSCISKITTLRSLDMSGNLGLTKLPLELERLTTNEMLKLEDLDRVSVSIPKFNFS